jgi:hypothetical protein
MSTAEIIYELVTTLPEERANLVLKFTQFLQQQGSTDFPSRIPTGTLTRLRGIAKPSENEHPTTYEERLALSQTARGRFAHLPNTSESFAQRKQENEE